MALHDFNNDIPELIDSDDSEENIISDEDNYEHSHYSFPDSDDEEEFYPYMIELLHEFLALNRFPMFVNVPQKSNTKCKFYMMGNCTKGQFCRFSHDFEPDLPPLIPLNQPQTTNVPRNNAEQKSSTPCTYYLKGNCLRGNSCKFSHSANMTWTNNESQNSQNQTTSSQNRNTEISCSICLEIVTETKKFGLLNKCNHTFCLGCIREWRKTNQPDASASNTRTCPLCRTQSDFVIPSPVFPATLEEKEVIIKAYKSSLKNIPCKYFEKYKKCPFGRNCFYLHNGASQPPSNCQHRARTNNNTNNRRPPFTSPSSVRIPAPLQQRLAPLLQRNPMSFELRDCSEDSDEEDSDEANFSQEEESEDSDEIPQLIKMEKPQPVRKETSSKVTNMTNSRNNTNRSMNNTARTNNLTNSTRNNRTRRTNAKDDDMPDLLDDPLPPRRIELLRSPTPTSNTTNMNRGNTNARNSTTTATNNSTNNNATYRTVNIPKPKQVDEMPELIEGPLPMRKIESIRAPVPATRSTANTATNNNRRTNSKSKKEDKDTPVVPSQRKPNATPTSTYNTRSKFKLEDEDVPPLVPLQRKKNINNNNHEDVDSSSEEGIPPLIPLKKGRQLKPDSDDDYEEEEDEQSGESSSEEELLRPLQRKFGKYYAKKMDGSTRRTRSQVYPPTPKDLPQKEEKLPQSKKKRK